MRRYSVPPTASGDHRKSPYTSWCSLGPVLMSAVFHLLMTDTDACGPPPRYETMRPKNATKDSYAPGESVVYQCRLGYKRKFSSSFTTVCGDDNSWTPLQEACTKKQCSNPGDLVNGRIIYHGTLEFGSKIEYVCDEGYRLIGVKTLHCELVGESLMWANGSPPFCLRVACKPPMNIENGWYSNSEKDFFEYSEAVEYKCNRTAGGKKYSLIGEKTLYCTSSGEWSSKPPKCKVVKCAFPVVENAKRIQGGIGTEFEYQAKVVFKCHKGFVMKGNNTVTCEEDSLWVPPLPQCVKVSTTPVSTTPVSTTPVSTLPSTSSPTLSSSAIPATSSGLTVAMTSTPTPGHSTSTKQPPIPSLLDGGSIALIAVGVLTTVTVVSIGLYKYYQHRKKGKREIAAEYTTYKDTSTSPAEQES